MCVCVSTFFPIDITEDICFSRGYGRKLSWPSNKRKFQEFFCDRNVETAPWIKGDTWNPGNLLMGNDMKMIHGNAFRFLGYTTGVPWRTAWEDHLSRAHDIFNFWFFEVNPETKAKPLMWQLPGKSSKFQTVLNLHGIWGHNAGDSAQLFAIFPQWNMRSLVNLFKSTDGDTASLRMWIWGGRIGNPTRDVHVWDPQWESRFFLTRRTFTPVKFQEYAHW